MNILIVYAHPNRESLNAAFLNSTIQHIDKDQHTTKVLDLYKESFDPVLHFGGDIKRRNLHKDPDLQDYRDQIIWADQLVFIYPIWWGRPPAILLGYFDKVFASGFAYKYDGKIKPEGLLKGKKVVCISTMKGPSMYPLLLLNNAHKVLMRKALFNFVGIKKIKFFEIGSVESKNRNLDRPIKKVGQYFKALPN